MRRLLWLGVGLAVGALAVRAVSKAAKRYSPSGMAESARDSATGLLDSMRDFVADVRDGMAEREAQLHAAMAQGVTFDEYDEELAQSGYANDEEFRAR